MEALTPLIKRIQVIRGNILLADNDKLLRRHMKHLPIAQANTMKRIGRSTAIKKYIASYNTLFKQAMNTKHIKKAKPAPTKYVLQLQSSKT